MSLDDIFKKECYFLFSFSLSPRELGQFATCILQACSKQLLFHQKLMAEYLITYTHMRQLESLHIGQFIAFVFKGCSVAIQNAFCTECVGVINSIDEFFQAFVLHTLIYKGPSRNDVIFLGEGGVSQKMTRDDWGEEGSAKRRLY